MLMISFMTYKQMNNTEEVQESRGKILFSFATNT